MDWRIISVVYVARYRYVHPMAIHVHHGTVVALCSQLVVAIRATKAMVGMVLKLGRGGFPLGQALI